ncbi:MAG TPA: secondary thiamine-phosphate synthase enzyme YjbQ [Thermoanaerobaculia bacterium]|nr:secondary thiamine-phosphate synthase enzyme YjbQ [Thermoanaerobaculia bacterium]HUM31064.1 secondary thiamine-phosphate synthase enzyme YjbQ [Thermoanaerobaculia bacterium]HXK69362.1 secondary thiamine-phosphate synthase enzyme YjbQ [Thermoanaerobaculia bacterium]
MNFQIQEISVPSKGFGDIIDLSTYVEAFSKEWEGKDGQLLVFVPGSTAAVTTIEFEAGAVEDLRTSIERLLPRTIQYNHDRRWGDGNGFSHVQAAWFGPSLLIPVSEGKPVLGTWQQIVLLDFDNRPRKRKVILQFSS